MTEQGWTVIREPIPGEANGYTTPDGTRRIIVDVDLEPRPQKRCFTRPPTPSCTPAGDIDPGENVRTAASECEAESVAYVLAGLLGLDTSTYSVGYVTTWTEGDVDAVRATAENVLRAVHRLAPALIDDEETNESEEVEAA